MSVEENKDLIRRMYEFVNKREFNAYYELLAPDFVIHQTRRDISFEQNKQFDALLFAAFPDLRASIENMVAEGDKVAFQVKGKLTHTGPFMGVSPTGKQIEITNTYIVRIVGNRIAEWWGTTEFPVLMQQLGIVPKP
jgi:predicted ester cyclase